MKAEEFQKFLFQSAVTMMACDGSIEEKEINEIKNIVENEIYFIGYDYEQPLRDNIDYIKTDANRAINQYLNNLSSISLSEKQELLLIEVLLRIIESDKRVEKNEVKFLQMIKSKLKTNEEVLITQFPEQVSYLIDSQNYGLHQEFTDEIKFKEDNKPT